MSIDTHNEFTPQPEFNIPPEEVLWWMQDFLHHLGLNVDPFAQPEAYRQVLKDIDPRHEKGQGLLRFQLEKDSRQWPPATKELIKVISAAMRMRDGETPPPEEDTPLNIAVAGTRDANNQRALYLAKHMAARQSSDVLVGVGSARVIKPEERVAVAKIVPNLPKHAIEEDLIFGAMQTVGQRFPQLNVDIAFEPNPKAGTPDVIARAIKHYAEQNSGLPPESATVCTNQIYWLSTQFDARRVAQQTGVKRIYVAGCPSDEAVIANRTDATYLSEMCRTARAALDLCQYEAGLAAQA